MGVRTGEPRVDPSQFSAAGEKRPFWRRIAPTVALADATPSRGRVTHYLAPLALAALVAAMIIVILSSGGGSGTHAGSTAAGQAIPRGLPPYWSVRPGDTYALI